MRFYYKPNETIIQSVKNKQTGKIKRFVVCQFDSLGELETMDTKVIYILQHKLVDCTWDKTEEIVTPEQVKDILDDAEIRELAKAKKIKSWHCKNIDNLKKELEV